MASSDASGAPGGRVVVDCTQDVAARAAVTWVGGVPLISRTLRLAARAGHTHALIAGGDRAAIAAALRQRPAPDGLTISYAADVTADAATAALTLDGAGVYASDELTRAADERRAPAPFARVTSPADARAATRELIRRTRKSIDADGLVAYYLFRPLSRTMSRAILRTPITPNHVSSTAMACGIAAAICAGIGGLGMVALAGLLYWVGAVIDCVDGELARVRLQGSKIGEWLDSLADEISTYGLLAGLGVGMVRDGHAAWWGWMGVGGGVVGFTLNLTLMLELWRAGAKVDTAFYPWFFGTPAGGEVKGGAGARFIYYLGFLARRDAVVTMVAIALAFGLRWLAIGGFMAGLAIFGSMFVVHHVTMWRRGLPFVRR